MLKGVMLHTGSNEATIEQVERVLTPPRTFEGMQSTCCAASVLSMLLGA